MPPSNGPVAAAFAAALRRAREQAQLTQEALAFAADLAPGYVSMLERGKHTPSLGAVFSLARALGIPADEFVGGVAAEMHKPRRRTDLTPRRRR